MTARQRRIRNAGDAVLLTYGDKFAFILPVHQVVVVLHGGKKSPAIPLGANLHVMELIAVHGRCADGTHLSGFHQRIQRLHGLLDGRTVVKAVNLIQVQIICTQATERSVNLAENGLAGKLALIEKHLGGNHNFVTGNADILQRTSKILFAGPERIDVGGVEEIDTQVDGVCHHSLSVFRAQGPLMKIFRGFSVGHAAYADAGNLNPGFSEGCVFHVRFNKLMLCYR